MGNLVLTGATSGSSTIVPTDAVTATLTLPSATGTLLSTANPQSGGVIQVVNYSSSGNGSSTNSTSMTTTGYGVTITPKFSTSKVFITVNSNSVLAASGNGYLTIYRNSTNLATGTLLCALMSFRCNSSGSAPGVPVSMTFLDSPATTSATTYTVYYATNSGNTIYFGIPNNDLSYMGINITAMEIAA